MRSSRRASETRRGGGRCASRATTDVIGEGVDIDAVPTRRQAEPDRPRVASERARSAARRASRAAQSCPAGSCSLLRTKPLAGRPTIPRSLREPRARPNGSRRRSASAAASPRRSIFVPALARAEPRPPRGSGSRCARSRTARHARRSPSSRAPSRPARRGRRTIAAQGRARACGRGREPGFAERRARARRAVPGRSPGGVTHAARDADPLADRAVDHLRPPHAHELVARLHRRSGRPDHARRGERPRRDRRHRPQRLRRRARDAQSLRATTSSIVIPGEEVKTDGQGEVIGLFLRRGDPARDVVRGDRRGDQGAGRRSSTCRIPSTACIRSPIRRRCSATSPTSTSSRSTTPRLLFEAYNDEALALRPEVQPDDGSRLRTRTCSRASAPAPCGCAPSTARRSSCSASSSAQVLRRPRSLVYLQSLKWMAQAKERVR